MKTHTGMVISNFALGIMMLALMFCCIRWLYFWREDQLRKMALRRNLVARDPSISEIFKFGLRRVKYHLPTDVVAYDYLKYRNLSTVWNVYTGTVGKTRVLFFDSIVGAGERGKGIYCSWLIVEDEDVDTSFFPESFKVLRKNGCCVIWRIRFWQIPWTISAKRIDAFLEVLSI